MEFSLFRSQAKIFDQLRFRLAPRRARILLRGPSGVGKTHLLAVLAEYHAETGKAVVVARGEQGIVRPFQAFLRATGPAATRLSTKRFASQAAEAATRAIPIAGSLATFVTQALTNERTRNRRERLRHLRGEEFEVLLHLESIIQDRDFLLVVDNLQYWDSESLTLLLDMLRGDALIDDFPFLERTACIVGLTDDRMASNAESVRSVLDHGRWDEERLHPIELDEVGLALQVFGAHTDIPQSELSAIYAVTGGHLALLQHLALEIRTIISSGTHNFSSSPPEILAKLMELRLSRTGSTPIILRTLLEAASVIGESFNRVEIACLTKFEDHVLRETLDTAQQIHLLTRFSDRHRFSHEVVRESLLRLLGENGREWHGALAKCLAIIRPWDYRTRAEHLGSAGDHEAAARFFFADVFQKMRHAWPVTDSDRNEIIRKLSATGQNRTASALLKAYTLSGNEALKVLESIPNTEHPYFVAEKELMRAGVIMSSTRTMDRIDAVHILEDCLRLEHQEPEIDMRIRLALLSGYTHLARKADARRTDMEISQILGKYRRFDPACESLLHVHYRKAATVWGAETSADRCREAADYFGPKDGVGLPRSPRQYFMALCNESGNLLNCGRIDRALVSATRGLEVFQRFGSLGIRDSEKCVNNLVISAVLISAMTPAEGRQLMDQAIDAVNPRRSWIHLSNRAVLSALTGDLITAERELVSARAAQEHDEVFDSYHKYLIGSNLAGIWHLLGNREEARQLWASFEKKLPLVPDLDHRLWQARHETQSEAFDLVGVGEVQEWFNFPQSHRPRGIESTAWNFFGRGFVLSDSQIWTIN